MAIAVQLDHVTKRYRAGRSRTLVDMVAGSVAGLRGGDSGVHSATRGNVSSTIAAMDDVTFDVTKARVWASSAGMAPARRPCSSSSLA